MMATPLRPRRDGWTLDRQAVFVAALTAGGSVAAAAAAAGMSRHSAYRLRRRNPAVAAAWSSAAPPLDADGFDPIIEEAFARREADYAAAGDADPRAAERRLIGELRVQVRRVKRRAAAVRRRAAETDRDGVRHLPPRDDANGGGVVPEFTARDRGRHGRFVAKNVVAV